MHTSRKNIQSVTVFVLFIAISLFFLTSCGSTGGDKETIVVPENLPEICKGIDFNDQPDMREVCGVRVVRYKQYKNVPKVRYMIVPKGAQLVRKKSGPELRLKNTLPVKLDASYSDKIEWSEDARLEYLKTTMDYKEFRQDSGERIKIFKLTVPFKDGSQGELCFNVPKEPEVKDPRSKTVRGNKVNSIDCEEYRRILDGYSVSK